MSNDRAERLLRKSFHEIKQLRAEIEKAEAATSEPIAIIGIACRTPGEVVDPEGYWTLLDEGRDVIGPFPERWDTAALYDPNPEEEGKTYAREGGFLRDMDLFDASFFGIAPREAEEMDPQQRLVLEVGWEALERAGRSRGELSASATVAYVGACGPA